MLQTGTRLFPSSSRGVGVAFLVVLICIWVIAQMLGTPLTLTTLLTADTSTESVCDDSIPPVKLDLELFSCALLHEDTELSLSFQFFETSAFHPPQA
jgi:hypothetical protein